MQIEEVRGLVSCLPSLRDARLIGTRLKSADAGNPLTRERPRAYGLAGKEGGLAGQSGREDQAFRFESHRTRTGWLARSAEISVRSFDLAGGAR